MKFKWLLPNTMGGHFHYRYRRGFLFCFVFFTKLTSQCIEIDLYSLIIWDKLLIYLDYEQEVLERSLSNQDIFLNFGNTIYLTNFIP